MDDELALLMAGDFPARIDGSALRLMDRSDAVLAFAPDGPGVGMWHNVLILPAHFGCSRVFG